MVERVASLEGDSVVSENFNALWSDQRDSMHDSRAVEGSPADQTGCSDVVFQARNDVCQSVLPGRHQGRIESGGTTGEVAEAAFRQGGIASLPDVMPVADAGLFAGKRRRFEHRFRPFEIPAPEKALGVERLKPQPLVLRLHHQTSAFESV